MHKNRFFIILLVSFILSPLSSFSEEVLSISGDTAVVDGAIDENEYSCQVSLDKDSMILYLNLNEEKLSVAVEAETTGWIGVGFNSLRMNGSVILIGYVEGTETAFRLEIGKGHAHSNLSRDDVLGYSLTEKDGRTVMEAELTSGNYIRPGQSELNVILAYGGKDSFRAMHRFRTSVKVKLDGK
jgi:hypothetical protein